MRSIERQLLAWVFGTLLLGAVPMAATMYVVTLDEMNEVFDRDLKNVAAGVARYQQDRPTTLTSRAAVPIDRHDEPDDAEIATFTWDTAGRLTYASDPRVPITFTPRAGLSHPRIGGEAWTVYTVVHDQGIVQAAQRRSARHEMAGESAAKMLPVLVALALVVGGLLVFGLRRGLRPLDVAARDVAGRSVRALEAIDTASVPVELRPMVRAINSLMAKLDRAFSMQRQFVADAAHELRTPIAALRLQLHLLEQSRSEPERHTATAALKQGVARAQRLIEQLLAIARTDPVGNPEPLRRLALCDLVRAVVEPRVARAEARGIDLGVELPAHAPDRGAPASGVIEVLGDTEQLAMLLENLIENALRFTPRGGVVDVGVAIGAGGPILFVRDTGPGISAEDRPRVFDRFFRRDQAEAEPRENIGSGLGLAIVQTIAERHGATVRLLDRSTGPGLDVRVEFPPVEPVRA
ncbi:hypothetical protein CDN99_27765 [Roseateles aquatilis]|uniref:histidine kinase n=1 Tax=Roseateles aquatilis TaxID=431061 RepID=A0A2D0ALP3_9BURK|nr:ATP-binding protein [Roseateles aquatilis]OWQ82908.1 hypothetical protein CDN99_27765 [Roseateles aquatilis]